MGTLTSACLPCSTPPRLPPLTRRPSPRRPRRRGLGGPAVSAAPPVESAMGFSRYPVPPMPGASLAASPSLSHLAADGAEALIVVEQRPAAGLTVIRSGPSGVNPAAGVNPAVEVEDPHPVGPVGLDIVLSVE